MADQALGATADTPPSRPASLTLERHELFMGPLPPPEALERYEAIQPGFAERLLLLTEREAQHRHGLESRAQSIAARDSLRLRERYG